MFVRSSAIYIILDILWIFLSYKNFYNSRLLIHFLLINLYSYLVIMPYCWFSYVSEMFECKLFRNKIFHNFCRVSLLIYILIVISSCKTGLIYNINDNLKLTFGKNSSQILAIFLFFFWGGSTIQGIFHFLKSKNIIIKRVSFMIILFIVPIIIATIAFLKHHISIYVPVAINISLILYLLSVINITFDMDPLTKLYNRRSIINLDKKFEDNISKGKCITIYYLDVDNFKFYNDEYGHNEGDQILAIVGKALRSLTNKYDIIPFRMGGDEFMIITYFKEFNEDFKKIIIEEIENTAIKEKLPYKLSISIGETVCNDPKKPFNQYIEEADKKMYEEKRAKKEFI